jgi:hypothetical protein
VVVLFVFTFAGVQTARSPCPRLQQGEIGRVPASYAGPPARRSSNPAWIPYTVDPNETNILITKFHQQWKHAIKTIRFTLIANLDQSINSK